MYLDGQFRRRVRRADEGKRIPQIRAPERERLQSSGAPEPRLGTQHPFVPRIQRQHRLEIIPEGRGQPQLPFHGRQLAKNIVPRLDRDTILRRLSQSLDVPHEARPNPLLDGEPASVRLEIGDGRPRQRLIHPLRLSRVDLDLVHERVRLVPHDQTDIAAVSPQPVRPVPIGPVLGSALFVEIAEDSLAQFGGDLLSRVPVPVAVEMVIYLRIVEAHAFSGPHGIARLRRYERPVLFCAQLHQVPDFMEFPVFTRHEDADRQRPPHVRKTRRRVERHPSYRFHRTQVQRQDRGRLFLPAHGRQLRPEIALRVDPIRQLLAITRVRAKPVIRPRLYRVGRP